MARKRKTSKIKYQKLVWLFIEILPLFRYFIEWSKWKWVGGGRYRSAEQIEQIFQTCSTCPGGHFDKFDEDEGQCTVCECFIHKTDLNANKAAMVTTKCPKGYWE